MKKTAFCYQIIPFTSLLFTLLTFLYCLIILAIYSPEEGYLVSALTIFLFFPFALCMAFANHLFRLSRIHPLIRVLLHLVATVLSFYLFFLLPYADTAPESSLFVVTVLAIVAYILVAALAAFLRASVRKRTEKRQAHESFLRE